MKTILKIALLTLIGFSFSACLKDDPITDYSEEAIKPIVLIPNGNFPTTVAPGPLALDFKPQAQMLDLYARVSSGKPLDKDVTVTFIKDPSIIAAYNTKFGTKYEELAATAYKLPALTFVIPAGQQEAKVSVELFADKVDLSKNNMLAFRLTDASGQTIASNFSQIVTPILVKNIYEGNYDVKGYFFHPSAPRSIGQSKYMSTISGTRCEGQVGDLGGWLFRFDVAANVSNWESAGSTPASPAAGFMTTDNPAGIPTYPGPGGFTNANFPNSYDAASKTFKFHYGYGGGSTSPAGWTRQIYETWKRL
jgi:hypothetical protein